MKTFRTAAMLLLMGCLMSLTGCVQITGEMNPDKSAYHATQGFPITHPLHENVAIGKVEDFPGTSIFAIMGKTSPNLTEETAEEALAETLSSVDLLAPTDADDYSLDMKLVDSGEMGFAGWETSLNGIQRTTIIHYTLQSVHSDETPYSKSITTTGKSDGGGIAFYLVEREAAEDAMRKNLEQMISDLKLIE
ncbi:hypothetical protein [Chromohalobacter moromii]|uniref:Lipoprotein n=1 Tax=Chromohalobacter moromii TaxID=2860329 RepID=A0A9X2X413_9GAMM|nr:hypothetical protein [Chromohalobacter moromii]MCK2047067.1 hypothetical protein [Chromohalobacter moromii]MCT8506644.1 hypothetical protein [Chromohalobacter moromii]